MNPIVSFEHVDKIYRRGLERVNIRALIPGRRGRQAPTGGYSALADVSFAVQPGEYVGIIGPNGAGKSTILKLAARVVAPTAGRVCVHGRLTSLIEVGVGFHPDLTGSENIRFAAAVLGMSNATVSRRYEEIVEFAGVERFMDTPVKRYSSGMLARLGFAVASHMDADVLVVDEVLAVGDAEFQRRSYERMVALRASGTAILLVSHNLWAVQEFCERVIHLDHGRIVNQGRPEAVINAYRASAQTGRTQISEDGPTQARILDFAVAPGAMASGSELRVVATIEVSSAIENGRIGIAVATLETLICAGVDVEGALTLLRGPGVWTIEGRMGPLPLVPGQYRVWLTLVEENAVPVVHDQAVADFSVTGESVATSTYGFVRIASDWSVSSRGAPSR